MLYQSFSCTKMSAPLQNVAKKYFPFVFFFFFCKTRGKRNCIARSNFFTTLHKQRQVKHLTALTNIESNVKCETDYGRIKFGGKNVLIFLYVIKRRYPFKMY